MTTPIRHLGMTLQVHVGNVAEATAFYSALFGRGPDFAPHEDFKEWQVLAGVELWWQIVEMPGACHPLTTRVRFLVDDVRTAAEWAQRELSVTTDPVATLPGVVAFTNFNDPWGNHLGYYQDIVPSGQQPEPGGSAGDESIYETDPMNRP